MLHLVKTQIIQEHQIPGWFFQASTKNQKVSEVHPIPSASPTSVLTLERNDIPARKWHPICLWLGLIPLSLNKKQWKNNRLFIVALEIVRCDGFFNAWSISSTRESTHSWQLIPLVRTPYSLEQGHLSQSQYVPSLKSSFKCTIQGFFISSKPWVCWSGSGLRHLPTVQNPECTTHLETFGVSMSKHFKLSQPTKVWSRIKLLWNLNEIPRVKISN